LKRPGNPLELNHPAFTWFALLFRKEQKMATYITLASFTDQGIRSVKDTTRRAAAVQEAAKKFGATMPQIYWTMGAYDLVAMVEAPDDLSASAFSLAIGMAGNIRGQTLRAFNKDEMNGILSKLG
jgi:uncharacterized protein with GYD domain